jgi:hypothetical protein
VSLLAIILTVLLVAVLLAVILVAIGLRRQGRRQDAGDVSQKLPPPNTGGSGEGS